MAGSAAEPYKQARTPVAVGAMCRTRRFCSGTKITSTLGSKVIPLDMKVERVAGAGHHAFPSQKAGPSAQESTTQ
eukprot:scaffold48680_cov25-Tisochrysis_lutea.AAC.1